jgi:hypothetical protein
VAAGPQINRKTLDTIAALWPQSTLAGKADQLFWRARNRYVAIRGDASAGKSTMINLMLGSRALDASEGQTTACITEVRMVGSEDGAVEPRVHLASERLLSERLDRLRTLATEIEFVDYRHTVQTGRERLRAGSIEPGSAVTQTDWRQLGFSTALGSNERHNVLVDRMIHLGRAGSPHPLEWALTEGVSFLDLPGDARGEVFNEVVLAEAQHSYAPAVTLRLWNAGSNDRPQLESGELLVITFLDDPRVVPGGNFMKTVHGTLQDYGRTPMVLSVAADAPAELNLVPLSAQQAIQQLRAWEQWLAQPAQVADPSYQLLHGAVRRTLAHPDGGMGVILDTIRDALEAAPRQSAGDADLRDLAATVRDEALHLRDQLVEPKPERVLRNEQKIARQRDRQERRLELAAVARASLYGEHSSEPWRTLDELIHDGYLDEPVDVVALLGDHATAAEAACYSAAGITAAPRLAEISAPLLQELGRLLTVSRSGDDPPSWVDVARVRWELCDLLTGLAAAAEQPGAPPHGQDPGTTAAALSWPEYSRRAGVLNACLKWAGSFH